MNEKLSKVILEFTQKVIQNVGNYFGIIIAIILIIGIYTSYRVVGFNLPSGQTFYLTLFFSLLVIASFFYIALINLKEGFSGITNLLKEFEITEGNDDKGSLTEIITYLVIIIASVGLVLLIPYLLGDMIPKTFSSIGNVLTNYFGNGFSLDGFINVMTTIFGGMAIIGIITFIIKYYIDALEKLKNLKTAGADKTKEIQIIGWLLFLGLLAFGVFIEGVSIMSSINSNVIESEAGNTINNIEDLIN